MAGLLRVCAGRTGDCRRSSPPRRGWAVSYGDLDELISNAHLARLTDAGYDFELSQSEPRSARSRIFVSSSTAPAARCG